MAVVHDNVDRRTRPRGIPEQWCLEVIYSSVERGPKLVIHWRKRQHFDVIDHPRCGFEFLDASFSIVLQGRTYNLAHEGDSAFRLHIRLEPIKHAVIR